MPLDKEWVTVVTVARRRLRSVIRERRIERGLTQEQLAKKAGVTTHYVTMVERGSRKGICFLVRIALVLLC